MPAAESTILGIDGGLLKSIALVAYFSIFALIALWLAFSKSLRFQRAAQLPLEDEDAAEVTDAAEDRGDH